jgi:hypothetical protein
MILLGLPKKTHLNPISIIIKIFTKMLSETKLSLLQQLVQSASTEEIIWTKGYLAGFLDKNLIKNAVPTSPKMIPNTLRLSMRSLRIRAESIKTIMGVVTIKTEAEMGEVKLNPLKKVSMLNATPKKAAAIIRGKSARSIFSLGKKNQINQNSTTDPPTRKTMKPKGKT